MTNRLYFKYDNRLGIQLPHLEKDWQHYTHEEHVIMVTEWEMIRGFIPDRIMTFEAVINEKQREMNEEVDFLKCCILNSEIADYASRINDLHLWFRLNQDIALSKNHA